VMVNFKPGEYTRKMFYPQWRKIRCCEETSFAASVFFSKMPFVEKNLPLIGQTMMLV